jgi:hypothetical protein
VEERVVDADVVCAALHAGLVPLLVLNPYL